VFALVGGVVREAPEVVVRPPERLLAAVVGDDGERDVVDATAEGDVVVGAPPEPPITNWFGTIV